MFMHGTAVICLSVIVIQALGEQLKFRQQVIATGTVYFKRFYARYVVKNCFLLILADLDKMRTWTPNLINICPNNSSKEVGKESLHWFKTCASKKLSWTLK